jgi:hypothetical protein
MDQKGKLGLHGHLPIRQTKHHRWRTRGFADGFSAMTNLMARAGDVWTIQSQALCKLPHISLVLLPKVAAPAHSAACKEGPQIH